MIGKIDISGGGFGGLCRYVMRERPQALNRRVSEPVFHASLRLPERETGRLSDRDWGEIGREYAERKGFGNAPYVVVCHGRDHAHIVASRVDFDGARIDAWRDRYRSQEILREVERQRGLEHPRERTPATERDADRRAMREAVDRAIQAGDGTRAGFDRELARDGRIVGVRFRRDDAPEERRGAKGSQLGKDYGGRALQARIAERDRTRELEREGEQLPGRGDRERASMEWED
jgi:hypothetical protein